MFRQMRRNRQALSAEACAAVLKRGTSGVLALLGDEDYPYAVPISYVYDGDKLYFHSARSGHKLDAVRSCPKASFSVIDQDQVVPEKYTTYFRSVILFGKIRILEGEEKRAAIEKLADRYALHGAKENRDREIRREWKALCVLEMTVEHMTGKEAVELVKGNSGS